MERDSKALDPITCRFGFGDTKQVDIEMPSADELWIAAGGGINQADIWMKAVAHGLDIRVHIERRENGLFIALDRGEQGLPWWPTDDGPHLVLETEAIVAHASVIASVGTGDQKREVVLGTIPLGG